MILAQSEFDREVTSRSTGALQSESTPTYGCEVAGSGFVLWLWILKMIRHHGMVSAHLQVAPVAHPDPLNYNRNPNMT